MGRIFGIAIAFGLLTARPMWPTGPSRIKDLASIEGVRENQLVGYGLVVGLNGTGDRRQTLFSAQTLTNLLERMGVTVPANGIQVKNVAAVMVTAMLPPYATPGEKMDVMVAAMGDATGLQGGLLVMTSLRGADGQVYAVAQGPVITGGFVAGPAMSRQTVNHPTAGRTPNGATIERAAPSAIIRDSLRLQLRKADFTTSARVSEVINRSFSSDGSPIAQAENSGNVRVKVPADYKNRETEFIAAIETLDVETDVRAKIVINERTGTIVMGKQVRISPVAVMHGNLTVAVQTNLNVSQPEPFSNGKTTVVPEVNTSVKEEKTRDILLSKGATVEELVRALNSIGSTSRDVIAILQALQSAGALQAEIEVI
jgi:flagellar P-ring protein FlgI